MASLSEDFRKSLCVSLRLIVEEVIEEKVQELLTAQQKVHQKIMEELQFVTEMVSLSPQPQPLKSRKKDKSKDSLPHDATEESSSIGRPSASSFTPVVPKDVLERSMLRHQIRSLPMLSCFFLWKTIYIYISFYLAYQMILIGM